MVLNIKEIKIEIDSHQPRLAKRYEEIEVDRQEIETNIKGYTKNR